MREDRDAMPKQISEIKDFLLTARRKDARCTYTPAKEREPEADVPRGRALAEGGRRGSGAREERARAGGGRRGRAPRAGVVQAASGRECAAMAAALLGAAEEGHSPRSAL